jgi:glycosyltransferase involved in cell wall biosynthesis
VVADPQVRSIAEAPHAQTTVVGKVAGIPENPGPSQRLLFLNRSYYPDVEATGQLLTELCSDLARRHEVTVIAGWPNLVPAPASGAWLQYQRHQGVSIIRTANFRFSKTSLLGRAVGLASYLLLAAWAAFRQRPPDTIVVETDPPMLGVLGALLKSWYRCRLVFYLQDLYPEVALALGKLRPGPLSWLLWLATQRGLRSADRVIVLGEDMCRRVQARGIDPRKIHVVPNWIDTATVRPTLASAALRQEWGLDGKFVVMYSGNLGLSQGLDSLLESACRLREQPVAFVLVGDGASKTALMARATEWCLDNVRFFPYQPRERLAESLGAADLHLIPLRRGLAGCIVPSKLYGILAAGVPYLAAVDEDSEVARVTHEYGTGLRILPDDPDSLSDALRWCLSHRVELQKMGRRGRSLAVCQYDRCQAIVNVERVLQGATPQG